MYTSAFDVTVHLKVIDIKVRGIMEFIFMAFKGFVLFMIIAFAVKMAVKDVLYEFKEDLVKEFGVKKASEDFKNEND
jgi:hypothetical protein